jgi:hypothetical protein
LKSEKMGVRDDGRREQKGEEEGHMKKNKDVKK